MLLSQVLKREILQGKGGIRRLLRFCAEVAPKREDHKEKKEKWKEEMRKVIRGNAQRFNI
jgi:hypothetical protein